MKPVAFTRARLAAATSLLAVLVLAGCSGAEEGTAGGQRSPSVTRSAAESAETASYEDGTYEARGTYGGGPSYLDVTITVDDDVITDVQVGTPATNPTSLGYQERFAAAVPDEVIGKDLGEVNVGKLAGSSTCPDGFNDAIAQIREDALAG